MNIFPFLFFFHPTPNSSVLRKKRKESNVFETLKLHLKKTPKYKMNKSIAKVATSPSEIHQHRDEGFGEEIKALIRGTQRKKSERSS